MFFAFRWVRRAILAVAFLVLFALGATATSIWYVARQDSHPQSDVIVVLGAAQFDGRPSSVFKARLQHARTLFEQGVAPRVVTVGGGRRGDRTTEAEAGAAFLKERDVKAVAVPEGTNTLESMQALDRLMAQKNWDRAVLVTDPWHSLRTRTMARDQGIDAQTSPTRTGPSVRTRGTQARYIGRETLAYLYYRVFGKSGEAGPSAI